METGWANPEDRTTTYPVDMACGHVEMRRMRPSTADALTGPDYLIHSQERCSRCRELDALELQLAHDRLAAGLAFRAAGRREGR